MISIIIPVYNAEKTISNCIESILKQENVNLEIICVNDMSTDMSKQIMDSIASVDPRVRIMDVQEKLGVSHARNEGLKVIKGEFLLFADADDTLTDNPFFLSQAVAEMEGKNADLLVFGYDIVSTNARKTVLPDTGRNKTINQFDLLSSIMIYEPYDIKGYPWNKIWRINKDKEPKQFMEGLQSYEDMLWCIGMSKNIYKAVLYNKSGYNYTVNTNSITRKSTPEHGIRRDAHSVLALNLISRFIREKNLGWKCRQKIDQRTILASWDCLRHAFRLHSFSTIKYRIGFFLSVVANTRSAKQTREITIALKCESGHIPQASLLSILANNYDNLLVVLHVTEGMKDEMEKEISRVFFFTSKIIVTESSEKSTEADMFFSNDVILARNTIKKISKSKRLGNFNKMHGIKTNKNIHLDYPHVNDSVQSSYCYYRFKRKSILKNIRRISFI